LTSKVPVGVLLSGSGTNLQALIDACARPDYPAQIAVVVSNKRSAYGLERARNAGIPAVWAPGKKHSDRAAHEAHITEILQAHSVKWVACLGYMRLLGSGFLKQWDEKVLNIHPALLPAFPGVDGQGQAHAHGAQIVGATVHLVDEGCDTGPILAQGATAALPGDDRDTLQQRILRIEHQLFPRVLRWAVEGRIQIVEGLAEVDLPEGETRYAWMSPE